MDASILQDISIEELLLVMAWRRLNQEGKEYIAHTLLLRQNFEEVCHVAEIRREDAERAMESIKKTAQLQGCTVEELVQFYEGKDPAYGSTLRRLVSEAEEALTSRDLDH